MKLAEHFYKSISLEGNAESVVWEYTVSYSQTERKETGAYRCSLQEQNKLMIKIRQFIFYHSFFDSSR